MARRALLIGVGRYLHGYPGLAEPVSEDLRLIGDALREAGVATPEHVGGADVPLSYAERCHRPLLPGVADNLKELAGLMAILRDTDLAAETWEFIALFLSRYPAPEHALDTDDAPKTQQSRPAGFAGLSRVAQRLISVDLDGVAPFYAPGSAIKPLQLAPATAEEDGTLEQVRDELAGVGYSMIIPADYESVKDVADRIRNYIHGHPGFDAEGRLLLAQNLSSLTDTMDDLSRIQFRAFLTELTETGLAADETERIARADLPRLELLRRHETVLRGDFPLLADVVTLACMADLEKITLGEALALLSRYRPLIEPRWNQRVAGLGRTPSPADGDRGPGR